MLRVLICFGLLTTGLAAQAADPVYLGMGIKIGEVAQDSAIIWTRVTQTPQRNNDGRTGPDVVGRVRGDADAQPVWTLDEVLEVEGALAGAPGQVRLLVVGPDEADRQVVDWQPVAAEQDYTHQWRITGLRPNTKYRLEIESAPPGEPETTDLVATTLTTAPAADTWKDVSFAVITGMMYSDLDDPTGFHIFPAMQNAGVDFLIPTGDTVYYDSDAPRARTVDMARYHWHRMYSLPRLIDFHNRVPAYWEKDDHDTLSDDAWPTKNPAFMLPLTWDDGLRLFREQVPMGDKTYRTYRWGKGLQIWLVEGRDFRSPNNAPDGPEKTIWGQEQREWLQQSILESDAEFRVLISPTPIVGPDRSSKRDNHSNPNFAWEGNLFRNWTKEQKLDNFFVCCGDRHWQYHSVDPETGLQEFSCGPASDQHAGGTPGRDMEVQPFHRVQGGFLTVNVFRTAADRPRLEMRFHGVRGNVVYTYGLTP